MKITLQDLSRFAREFLHVLQRENINSIQALEKIAQSGEKEITINVQESLIFAPRPSHEGTIAYTMSYVVQGAGIPIELKINKEMGYTRSIIKFAGTFPG